MWPPAVLLRVPSALDNGICYIILTNTTKSKLSKMLFYLFWELVLVIVGCAVFSSSVSFMSASVIEFAVTLFGSFGDRALTLKHI